jgi:hypothetical protein
MKANFLLFLPFFPLIGLSQIKTEGFYISKNNDSVRVTFKIPKKPIGETSDLFSNKIDFFAMKEGVEIIDSSGNASWLTPSASKGIVFNHKSRVYELLAAPVNDHHWCFLRPEVIGTNMRLLYFIIEHPKRKVSTGAFGATRYSTLEEYFWTLEKHDGSYLFLRSTMKEKEIARLLTEYFRDKPKIQSLVDKKFQPFSFGEIPARIKSIVEAYNAS